MEADIKRVASAVNAGKIILTLGADGRAYFDWQTKDEFGDNADIIRVYLPTKAQLNAIKAATQTDLTALTFLINNYPVQV